MLRIRRYAGYRKGYGNRKAEAWKSAQQYVFVLIPVQRIADSVSQAFFVNCDFFVRLGVQSVVYTVFSSGIHTSSFPKRGEHSGLRGRGVHPRPVAAV